MNTRTIPRAAIDGSIKLARLPFDAALGVLPGREKGQAAAAKVALDRADAQVRATAGTLLGDRALREDAARRRQAADERAKALRLRGKAQERMSEAEAHTERRRDTAERRRQEAETRAKRQKSQAEKRREQAKSRASETAKQREQAAETQAARAEERLESEAKIERLDALQEKSEALEERSDAIATQDEAQRLGEAAAAVKAERKDD